MKSIYKDTAGNKLFRRKKGKVIEYFAKNVKNEIMSKHGLYSMMKEKGISTKGLIEDYRGKKRKIKK